MNILLITDSYPPEIRSASHLMQELAEELNRKGHNVTVITSYPKYNLSEENKDQVFSKCSIENKIKVIRLKTPSHHKVNFNYRGFAQLIMPFVFFFKGRKYLESNIDVVIVYSPPLPLAILGIIIKKLYNARFILNIQDIFPQNAIDLGILTNKILILFFEWIEMLAYNFADKITVHSEGNLHFLLDRKKISNEKLSVLHNWVDIKMFENIKRTGKFRKKYGLEGKFIFLFAGVIGPAQELDFVIEIANKIKDKKEICFLIVGDGTKRNHLINLAQKYNLNNVVFKDFVSKTEYPELVKDADLGLVCLSSKNNTPVVPGKILGYMSASVPIIAFLNKESDGHKIIREAKCGYSLISEDVDKAKDLILKIYNERNNLNEQGENGYKYVSLNFQKEFCLNKLEKLF